VPVGRLMGAAGRQVARFCQGATTVVCGTGNNGGDGLAAARHLHRQGVLVRVCCIEAGRLKGPAANELTALQALGVNVESELSLEGSVTILDALLGTGLSRAPEGKLADWIYAMNASGQRVVAVDLPSGLDGDTGEAYAPCVIATTTVTLGLPKPGLFVNDGPDVRGEVFVANIGMPPEAYAALGIDVPADLFATSDCVKL